MILIYTGVQEFDMKLNNILPNSRIAYYSEYLLQEKDADTVVMSTIIDAGMPLKDFLFSLRKQDKRVILWVHDEEYIKYALALGIYDLLFDPLTPEMAAEVVNRPKKFSDVAHLFLNAGGRVEFSDAGFNNVDAAIKQVEGLLNLLGGKIQDNLNDALVELEQAVIRNLAQLA